MTGFALKNLQIQWGNLEHFKNSFSSILDEGIKVLFPFKYKLFY